MLFFELQEPVSRKVQDLIEVLRRTAILRGFAGLSISELNFREVVDKDLSLTFFLFGS